MLEWSFDRHCRPGRVALLRQQWPSAEIRTELLPDDEDVIAKMLDQLSLQGVALVLTAGGTGLGPRDRTPEATQRVIDREAPGLAEAMRFHGSKKNRFAWLSRGVAGLKGSTVIVNLSRQPARSRGKPYLHSRPVEARSGDCCRWPEPSMSQSELFIRESDMLSS